MGLCIELSATVYKAKVVEQAAFPLRDNFHGIQSFEC